MGGAWAVIVAGGRVRTRVGAPRPKAFVEVAGRPLLAASVAAFAQHGGVAGVVCVVPAGREPEARSIVGEVVCVAGGATRAESVANGLAALPAEAATVLVHDCARPLVDAALIDRVLARLAPGDVDGVIPVVPVTDTIKRLDGDGLVVETPARATLVAVQTPQGFPVAVLRAAIAAAGDGLGLATDCASLVEAAGGRVATVPGAERNRKVTVAADLDWAAAALEASHAKEP